MSVLAGNTSSTPETTNGDSSQTWPNDQDRRRQTQT